MLKNKLEKHDREEYQKILTNERFQYHHLFYAYNVLLGNAKKTFLQNSKLIIHENCVDYYTKKYLV